MYQFTLHSDNRSSTISNAAVCRMIDTLNITHIQRLGNSENNNYVNILDENISL